MIINFSYPCSTRSGQGTLIGLASCSSYLGFKNSEILSRLSTQAYQPNRTDPSACPNRRLPTTVPKQPAEKEAARTAPGTGHENLQPSAARAIEAQVDQMGVSPFPGHSSSLSLYDCLQGFPSCLRISPFFYRLQPVQYDSSFSFKYSEGGGRGGLALKGGSDHRSQGTRTARL